MARGGLYRTDVEKARTALLAQGKHPSVDAIRVALGNTGSKTTIHRHLKDIEAELGSDRKVAISDALQDFVARLAGQLQEESEAVIAAQKAAAEAAISAAQQAADQSARESSELRDRIQRLDLLLAEERTDHSKSKEQLTAATVRITQLEERTAGLAAQLQASSAHAQSLEQKHEHAREALDHYRNSVKEQRDQDQRRHEHQIQELQTQMRKASELIVEKNHQVLQLNRDNARLVEHESQLERHARELESNVRKLEHELAAAKLAETENQLLRGNVAQQEQLLQSLRSDLTAANAALNDERSRRAAAELDAARELGKATTLESLIAEYRSAAAHPAISSTGT